ncbi:MAG TPA: hypothetical protein VIX59_05545 [Candidatus Binataceae bacterium]
MALAGGKRVNRNASGFMTIYPAHDDTSPSLSLSLGHKGNLIAWCFSGRVAFADPIRILVAKGLVAGSGPVNPEAIAMANRVQAEAKRHHFRRPSSEARGTKQDRTEWQITRFAATGCWRELDLNRRDPSGCHPFV